jgi:hypothetical protein
LTSILRSVEKGTVQNVKLAEETITWNEAIFEALLPSLNHQTSLPVNDLHRLIALSTPQMVFQNHTGSVVKVGQITHLKRFVRTRGSDFGEQQLF